MSTLESKRSPGVIDVIQDVLQTARKLPHAFFENLILFLDTGHTKNQEVAVFCEDCTPDETYVYDPQLGALIFVGTMKKFIECKPDCSRVHRVHYVNPKTIL